MAFEEGPRSSMKGEDFEGFIKHNPVKMGENMRGGEAGVWGHGTAVEQEGRARRPGLLTHSETLRWSLFHCVAR